MPVLAVSYTFTAPNDNSAVSPDGIVRFSQPILVDSARSYRLRMARMSVPKSIPNIFSFPTQTTAVFAISYDAGANWDQYRLVNGAYTISALNSAIQECVKAHFTEEGKTKGIVLRAVTSTGHTYFEFDYSYLLNPLETITISLAPIIAGAPGDIDVGRASKFNEVLGFAPGTISGAGTHLSDFGAQIDYLGNEVALSLLGDFGPSLSCLNGVLSNRFFTMELGPPNQYSNVFAMHGLNLSALDISPTSRQIQQIGLDFRSVDGKKILILQGTVSVDLELIF